MCLEQDTILELLHMSCPENFGCSSQLRKFVAGFRFYSSFTKYTNTCAHKTAGSHSGTSARTHAPPSSSRYSPCMPLSQMESLMHCEGHRWLAGRDSIGAAAMTPLGRLGRQWNQTGLICPQDWRYQQPQSLLRMRSLSRPSPDLYHTWTKVSGSVAAWVSECKVVGVCVWTSAIVGEAFECEWMSVCVLYLPSTL